MDVPVWVWAATVAFIVALLVYDLLFHVRKAHVPTLRESSLWSALYIGIAVLFGVGVLVFGGVDMGSEYFAGYVTEKALSVDNLEAVLGEAGMSLANLVRLNVYTTDVDLLFPHYGVLAARLGAAGVAPTTTMLGVTRLAIPGQMVELEGTAVA